MPRWNDKNKQWEDLPDKKEDSDLMIISNETLSTYLVATMFLVLVCGLIVVVTAEKFKYDTKINNAELIPYETLMKKGLAKPVKDENGDLKLKLMECE